MFLGLVGYHKASLGTGRLSSSGREKLLQRVLAMICSVLPTPTIFSAFSEFINERTMKSWLKQHVSHFSVTLQ